LCRYTSPPPPWSWLADLAAFDHERVRVELADEEPGEDPRAASVKRFPVWGDADQLIGILDVRREGPGSYVSVARSTPRRPVVEGSQMLGQAIVAAGRHAPGRRMVSGHMVFFRGADAAQPLRFELEAQSGGRTFSTLSVRVSQAGRVCAGGTLLLDVTAPDVIRHSEARPAVPGPYDCAPYDMSVMGRDIRVVDNAYTDDPDAPVGPAEIDAWVRFRRAPDDPALHAGLLAQFTGHMSIAAALRAHEGVGQRQAHRTLSTAINAIGISLHSEIRADRWMLYHHRSTFAGDGMTHSSGRVHDETGRLLASFTVDAMVRKFAGSGEVDDRTAL
jgi:acyl-CoA thioesterase